MTGGVNHSVHGRLSDDHARTRRDSHRDRRPGPLFSEVSALPGELAQEDPAFSGRPDDGFLRLDVELFTQFTARIGGHDFDVRPYLRVINALDQRDALFFYFEPWRDAELRPLAERSLLPVLGVEWRF